MYRSGNLIRLSSLFLLCLAIFSLNNATSEDPTFFDVSEPNDHWLVYPTLEFDNDNRMKLPLRYMTPPQNMAGGAFVSIAIIS